MRSCIGLLIMMELFIFGSIWLLGRDLSIKEKIKIAIEVTAYAGILSFGVCWLM